MNLFVRWCRFNAVGVMGMAVQLTVLAILNRWTGGHYLLSTVGALEVTLVHNFFWHLRYTWPDRRTASSVMEQFAKFHLANGMISLVGNLALMQWLVAGAQMSALAANGIAILVCSVANFGIGHMWAFTAGKSSKDYRVT